MAIPSLKTRALYGLRTDVDDNACFLNDTEVLYPVGNALSIHDISQGRQKLIRLSDKQQINVMCVAPNKIFTAVCEMGEKPTISIYDTQSLKKRKTLGIPYETVDVHKFLCIDFSYDSKYIAAVTGEPDQTMLYYNWEKGKVESSLRVGSSQSGLFTVQILACNPSDAGVLALGGLYNFKFLTLSESVWRSYGFSKADNIPICSMAWLNADRLLAGTKDGRILYLENGDLKNIYRMSETLRMDLKLRRDNILQAQGSEVILRSGDETSSQYEIIMLRTSQKGFAFAFGAGMIIFFEKEGPHKYSKRNVFLVPQQIPGSHYADLYRINATDINPSADRIIVSCGWPRLFYGTLWGPDLSKDADPRELEIVGESAHYGPVGGLSVCAWKPIFMTFGEVDRTIKLWDLETASLTLMKQYVEDIRCIALHPTGLFCLIGFPDKLRFMSILINDTSLVYEFPIRNSEMVEFSYGGQLFAAVNGNMVQIYSTVDFVNRHFLKGHTGKVSAVVWSRTDTTLLTMGLEGAIYQWDITSGERIAEIILKSTLLKDITLSSEGSHYCIADDDYIREINDYTIAREFYLPGVDMYRLIAGKDDALLFATSPGGIILSFRCPLQEPLEYTEFHMHCTDITKIVLSCDDRYLISVAIDGSLCIWNIHYPVGRIPKADQDMVCMREILIGESNLKDKLRIIEDLQVRLKELETEHAYRLRQTEVQHNDKIRQIHWGYVEAIEELRRNIDDLEEQRANELNTINLEIVKMKEAHEAMMKKVEGDYEAKLINEYDKYRIIENHNNTMRQDYEKRIADLKECTIKEKQETVRGYEAHIREKNLQLAEAQEELAHQAQLHQRLTAQVEDDADREIVELRTSYEAMLDEKTQLSLKLKGEASIMRNKYAASQSELEDLKRRIQNVYSEYGQFQKVIRDLEKDVLDMKKRIDERDSTIQERERRISDLKRTNQKLEKFKFVLNHKIDELKNQIDPRDREIDLLEKKIRDMENELVILQKINVTLELQLNELKEKLCTANREIQKSFVRNRHSQTLLHRIRTDLLDAAAHVQEPAALKLIITNLYHKYSASENFFRSHVTNLSVYHEFTKQRDHLERTVAYLKKQIFANQLDVSKGQRDKTIVENADIILELNALREELKKAGKHIGDVKNLLGLTGVEVVPAEGTTKLEKACKGFERLQSEFQVQMLECHRLATVLQNEIKRLLSKFLQEETINRQFC